MAAAAERLAKVSLECRAALDVIGAYGVQSRCLLMCDPPYLGTTRTSINYQHEMPGEAEHRELAGALAVCRAAVVVCGYPSPLYDELYRGWHRAEIQTATGQAHAWNARTEVLWSNRPFPRQGSLFDMEDAGLPGQHKNAPPSPCSRYCTVGTGGDGGASALC